MRILEMQFDVETKTKDNVFCVLTVSILYRVMAGKEMDAYYKLTNPLAQLTSYVQNNCRAQAPKFNLDELFVCKDEIAHTLKKDLEHIMNSYGYTVMQTLVVDLKPDASVKRAMNEINAAARNRVAANDKAEADKIQTVKAAEADAESKRLSGVGLAEQRKAIVLGLRESMKAFSSGTKVSQKEVMELLLMNQYFDTMKDMCTHAKSTTIFMSHNPDTVGQMSEQIRDSLNVHSDRPAIRS
jgi:regulator of protease activity HflC (stomatin/prohibitin superfamily)